MTTTAWPWEERIAAFSAYEHDRLLPSVAKQRQQGIKRLAKFAAGKKPSAELFAEYIGNRADRGITHHTIKEELGNLRAFAKWGIPLDLLPDDVLRLLGTRQRIKPSYSHTEWEWDAHISAYVEHQSINRRDGGVDAYHRVLGRLAAYADGRYPTEEIVEGWLLTRRGRAPATIGAEVCAIKSFVTWCKRRRLLVGDPTALLERPSVLRGDVLEASHEAIQAVAAWLGSESANPRSQRFVALCLYAGLRFTEARLQDWSKIDLDCRQLVVSARIGKGGKGRRLPISPPLLKILSAVPADQRVGAVAGLPDGRPLSRGGAEKIFRHELQKYAGIDVTAHQLRRAFATRMDEKGVSIRVIQTLLGHSSLATTERYIGVDNGRKQSAVDLLDGAFG